jgi:hypothetical protein
VQKNVGSLDAFLRITCGLAGLSWSAAQGRRRFPCWFAALSAMKVAEGITRFCPLLALLGLSTAREGRRCE